MPKFYRSAILALCVFLIYPCISIPSAAQVRPVNDYGALGLGRLLKRLNTTASVMMIGAHPDDEDSALIAYMARGENARTAYLSLTRGDGGQNIIGPELFESLGVIRTEELLQARRLDGAEQYFTRAYDYGFSKTLAEAKEKWDEKTIVCDAVRAIRLFRPLVVISRFSGTPADGHGQHQYAGYISPIAVKAAADPQQCSDSGLPWQVKRFYIEQGFRSSGEPTVRSNTGKFDPLLGRSYFEIAMEGRSQHKSQGEGRIEYHGDQYSGLNLAFDHERKPGDPDPKSIFDGIDTTLTGIPSTYGVTAAADGSASVTLREIQASAERALDEYDPAQPGKILQLLLDGCEKLRQLADRSTNEHGEPDVAIAASRQAALFMKAIERTIGLQIDALADAETIAPGGEIVVSVKAFFPKNDQVLFKKIEIEKSEAWTVDKISEPADSSGGRESANGSAMFKVKAAQDAQLTQPYWLTEQRTGDLFRWPANSERTLPFTPPSLVADVRIEVGGKDFIFKQPVEYRYADQARGEIRRDINIVPTISLDLSPSLLIVPLSNKAQTRQVSIRIVSNQASDTIGSMDLKLPKGWTVDSRFGVVKPGKKGESRSFNYNVTIPAGTRPGSYMIGGSFEFPKMEFGQSMTTIAYPHIQTHRFYKPAKTLVEVLDLKVAPVNVGYIIGSGDDVPAAIEQMGLKVTMLDAKDLASGDLSKFDTIVVGIRASETRPDLVSNNQRLLDYVKEGGNMIVQYQRGNWTALAPFAATTADTQRTAAGSIARVVDENAQVSILEPDNSILTFPNKISVNDFKNWVQERNAYNLVTFDPQYVPLLESHDAGESENKGGLVTAKLGKGNWTYCSYSMFRQLPAGVGGAYRLFANLLSLPKGQNRVR